MNISKVMEIYPNEIRALIEKEYKVKFKDGSAYFQLNVTGAKGYIQE